MNSYTRTVFSYLSRLHILYFYYKRENGRATFKDIAWPRVVSCSFSNTRGWHFSFCFIILFIRYYTKSSVPDVHSWIYIHNIQWVYTYALFIYYMCLYMHSNRFHEPCTVCMYFLNATIIVIRANDLESGNLTFPVIIIIIIRFIIIFCVQFTRKIENRIPLQNQNSWYV